MAGMGGGRYTMWVGGVVFICAGLGFGGAGCYRMTHLHKNERAGDALVYLMLPLMGIAAVAGGFSMFGSAREIAQGEAEKKAKAKGEGKEEES